MKLKLLLFFLLFAFSLISVTSETICKNGETRPCNLPGVCSLGTQTCTQGAWSDCSVGPREEICFDKLDNNCDGIVDENCLCTEGGTRPCGIGIGICNLGEQACINGTWSDDCQNAIQPINETCENLLDDDCDGFTDSDDPNCKKSTPAVLCNNNGIKDANETGIDCGGPSCPTCPTCSDGILNQGEIKINQIIDSSGKKSDCGGPSCPSCPTCSDNIKNQGEQGVDCGSQCTTSCDELLDSDGDGITDSKEREKGTDPRKSDTDNDGSDDLQDTYPLCPNAFCDVDYGENSENCPQDCSSIPIFPIIVIFFILIPLIGFLLYFLVKKKSSKKEKKEYKIHSSFLKQTQGKKRPDELTEKLKKIK